MKKRDNTETKRKKKDEKQCRDGDEKKKEGNLFLLLCEDYLLFCVEPGEKAQQKGM